MIDSIYIGATGMQAQQLNVDVIANNLANVNTTGFKKNRVSFEDTFYQAIHQPSNLGYTSPASTPIAIGMGTLVSSNSKSFTQGDIKATESPYDVAIRGNGLFEVLLPDGSSAYTRHGALKVTQDGLLGTNHGYELKQQVQIPADILELVIDSQGKVLGRSSSENKLVELGQIELSSLPNLEGLQALGENLFIATEKAGQVQNGRPGEDGLGLLSQGYLESSNVKLAEEMVNLVLAQRAYELNAKIIQASDEMLSISNNLRR
ncbi:flagellar basal-body rod protein FlgG [Pseudomethylobacillus aquaticus]|uniref:Flagellar basal-body rod protein FlgG n=1 Tax=Pseudomethylobacillus aquaticus TaxID=2676064 RepID=A0A3N0UZA0_9PROT|nr:flagellar basal-body rod protein FlgG [Pseudomethylobacillus aquaticus]ROH85896.1 flagellar basal-body rod protein FlgG [Pseudomethylobacillus aquaticus]